MSEEIIAGLKNAMQRGDSLDKAVQSFINAGYNPVEVRQAANDLSSGASTILFQEPETHPMQQQFQQPRLLPLLPQSPQQYLQPPRESMQSEEPKKRGFITLLILLLLLLVAGIILLIFYGEELLAMLFG